MFSCTCNVCGRQFGQITPSGNLYGGIFIYHEVGYGSEHDGEVLEMSICYDCLDKIIGECAVNPIE